MQVATSTSRTQGQSNASAAVKELMEDGATACTNACTESSQAESSDVISALAILIMNLSEEDRCRLYLLISAR